MEDIRIINNHTSKKIAIQMIICCIIVVTYHSTGYKYYNLNQSLIDSIAKLVVDLKNPLCQLVALPSFCFFSGFLFYKNIDNPKFPYDSIKKRLFTLLLPYLLWNFIWTLFMVVISFFPAITSQMSTIKVFSWSIREFVWGVLLHKYCGVTWYLLYMFVYALFSPVFCRILKHKTISTFVIMILVLISPVDSIVFDYKVLIWPLYLYLLGAYYSIHHFDYINNNKINNYNKTIIAMFAILMLVGSQWKQTGYIYSLLYNCFRVIGFYLAWYVLNLFYEKIRRRKWMDYYFFIYVFHNIPLLCVDKILRFLMPDNWIGMLLNHFFGVITVVLMAIISARILEQFVPKLWFLLTGRRQSKIITE